MFAMAAARPTAWVCNARGTATATAAASATPVGAGSTAQPSVPRAGPAETTCAWDCRGFVSQSPARPAAVIASAAPLATAAAAPSSAAIARPVKSVPAPATASPQPVTAVACPPIPDRQGFLPLPRLCPYATSARRLPRSSKPPPCRRSAHRGVITAKQTAAPPPCPPGLSAPGHS
jgi:hypothetical protein